MHSAPRSRQVFLVSVLIFLPMAFVGTMVHEAGHLLVAEALGYDTCLHYGSVGWWPETERRIPDGHEIAVRLGGPVMNMLIGTIGLVWLLRLRRPAESDEPLGAKGWVATLLSLFWSRQLFNAVRALQRVMTSGEWGHSDEVLLAEHLSLPLGSLSLVTGCLALFVCGIVVVQMPRGRTLPWLAGGLLGSLAGFVVWYGYLGPRVLP